jgi:chemotaxis-related protein WspB
MLFLLFRLGNDPYAVDVRQVVEILPVVNWKTVPQTVPGILGVINYLGRMVPLLDLSTCVIGAPSRLLMSTRIVLIQYGEEQSGGPHLLGLLVEEAVRTFSGSLENFSETGIQVETAPYLGPVITSEEGTIQFVDVERLLPVEVKHQLVGLAAKNE